MNPRIYNLSGTSVLPVSLTPASLTFPAQARGTTSAPQIVALRNNKNVPLAIASIVASGQYAATPGGAAPCGASLCSIPDVHVQPNVYAVLHGGHPRA